MLGLGACLMPGIPMKIIDRHGNILPGQHLGLVDSGADCSTFPEQWAKALGIDLQAECNYSQGQSAGGLGDQYKFDPGVDAIVVGRKIHLEAVFRPGLPIILLGREDFFQAFKVSFDQPKKTFRVEDY
jgi:hypothetical protein